MALHIEIWTTGEPVAEARSQRGRFIDMFAEAFREADVVLAEIDCVSQLEIRKSSVDAVIVTGSPARLGDQEPWMLRVEEALRRVVHARVPLLGVCFGHQLLAEALGGRVAPNPSGREIGSVNVSLLGEDPLLCVPHEDLPVETVTMSHLDSVVGLPSGAQVLACSGLEPNAAVRFDELAWGVQFHPEMDAAIAAHYILARAAEIESEGLSPQALLADLRDGAYGMRMLQRFARLAAARRLQGSRA